MCHCPLPTTHTVLHKNSYNFVATWCGRITKKKSIKIIHFLHNIFLFDICFDSQILLKDFVGKYCGKPQRFIQSMWKEDLNFTWFEYFGAFIYDLQLNIESCLGDIEYLWWTCMVCMSSPGKYRCLKGC